MEIRMRKPQLARGTPGEGKALSSYTGSMSYKKTSISRHAVRTNNNSIKLRDFILGNPERSKPYYHTLASQSLGPLMPRYWK